MVTQVIGTLRGGGAERVALTLHKAFKELKESSKILVLSNKIDYDVKKDKNIFIEVDIDSLSNEDLNIAHMQDISIKIKNKNVWHVIHNSYSLKFKNRSFFSKLKHIYNFRKTYNNKKLICVSNGVKEDVLKNLKVKPKKIITIYNPFDIEEIKKAGQENIDLEFDYIINVAGLTKVKNQALLLKAYALLDTKLHLVLLGKGNQKEKLKKLSKTLNIEDKVHFLGWKSNPYKYIKKAKLFVLSSNIEGFGNVLVESLILNTPVVSTNCPSGPNEILIDELSEFLSKVEDKLDLVDKMKKALNNYPPIREDIYKRFDYIDIAKKYIELK